MIPLFYVDGTRIPFTYNGLTFNNPTNIEDAKTGIEVHSVAQSAPADYISDKLQWRDGSEVYGVTKASRVIVMTGAVYGASIAVVADYVRALCSAFDPGRVAFNNDDPFLPLTYALPTADTTTYPSGTIALKVFVMPTEVPLTTTAQAGLGMSNRFRVTLIAKDPRSYLQTPVTRTDAGVLTYPTAYPSYPTITFSMSGAGATNWTVTNTSSRQGTKSLVLDLSGRSAGQAITVDFANQRVLVNGTHTQGIYVSGDWWQVEYGTNTLVYANLTGMGTARTITAYPAFSS